MALHADNTNFTMQSHSNRLPWANKEPEAENRMARIQNPKRFPLKHLQEEEVWNTFLKA